MSAPRDAPDGLRRLCRRSLAAVHAVALLSTLVLALATLPRRIGYVLRLAGTADPLDRGSLAADERVSPFATAGQVRWRASLDSGPRRTRTPRSGLALAWRFFAESAPRIRPADRYYLAVPNNALYMYGEFLWYPARLEVAPALAFAISDGNDLIRASAHRHCSDRDWLRARGYAGCVDAEGSALRLTDLGGGEP